MEQVPEDLEVAEAMEHLAAELAPAVQVGKAEAVAGEAVAGVVWSKARPALEEVAEVVGEAAVAGVAVVGAMAASPHLFVAAEAAVGQLWDCIACAIRCFAAGSRWRSAATGFPVVDVLALSHPFSPGCVRSPCIKWGQPMPCLPNPSTEPQKDFIANATLGWTNMQRKVRLQTQRKASGTLELHVEELHDDVKYLVVQRGVAQSIQHSEICRCIDTWFQGRRTPCTSVPAIPEEQQTVFEPY